MFGKYDEEAQFAIWAVTTAARLCRQIQQEMVVSALSKDDRSPVTVADFASQAVVAHRIDEAFPGIPLVAEEDSSALRSAEHKDVLEAVTKYTKSILPQATTSTVCEWIDRGGGNVGKEFWTLDPIDGTKGFLRGGQYAVALALVEEGRVVVGALGCPTLDEAFNPRCESEGIVLIAVRGEGTWVKGLERGEFEQLHVSDCAGSDCARMLRSFESAHTDPAKIERFLHEMGMTRSPVLMDSSAKYALLAGGKGEMILRLVTPFRPDYTEKIWDHAAGSLIVEEAGGRVTDLKGLSLDFSLGRLLDKNVGLLASNGHLHEMALAALAAIGADRRPEAL
jgi:3'(2'), 5'-bisphosphate nucleotidase